MGDRINELQAKLDDRCSELQSAATAVTQFNEQVKTLTHDLSGLEAELDAMKPPGRDFKTVRAQIDDVGRLIKKINKASDDVNNTIAAGERLVDSGFAPDTVQTRQQVDTLRKQLGKFGWANLFMWYILHSYFNVSSVEMNEVYMYKF